MKNIQSIIDLPQTESRIGAKTTYAGTLVFQKSIGVWGKIEGKVKGGELLIVHQSAELNADIEADYVLIAGKVTGKLNARKGVCLYTGAVFRGSMISKVIRMHAGADFEGNCNLLERDNAIDIFSLSRGEFRSMLTEYLSLE